MDNKVLDHRDLKMNLGSYRNIIITISNLIMDEENFK